MSGCMHAGCVYETWTYVGNRWWLNSCVEVWVKEWMDGTGPRSKWNLLYIVWNPSHFTLWIISSRDSPLCVPSHHQHTKWISTCKAIVHTVCVMKSMIVLFVVNLFHHFLYPYRPVYQKYVCCYCVHTISVTIITQRSPKYHSHTDIRTWSYFTVNNSYSDFCYSYFCLCVDQYVCFLCRSPCLVWRSLFWKYKEYRLRHLFRAVPGVIVMSLPHIHTWPITAEGLKRGFRNRQIGTWFEAPAALQLITSYIKLSHTRNQNVKVWLVIITFWPLIYLCHVNHYSELSTMSDFCFVWTQ